MAATYDFGTQLAKGEAAERLLDAHFSEWFQIAEATRDEQRLGIDRWYAGRTTGARRSVEYKTDFRAAQTGNGFVETVSVNGQKRGWVYTSQADWLFLYCPGFGGEAVYMLKATAIRSALAGWLRTWPERTVHNNGYVSKGVPVPLREFEKLAFHVVSL